MLGTFRAIGEMGLKLNVIGIIAACENMPSGRATKPGDIVTSMNGLTIEVLNTDAEGRLVLCDALTYAERFKPAAVVDIATLTGACIVALGHHNAACSRAATTRTKRWPTNCWQRARQASDTAWRLPIEEAYNEQLKSNFADLANIGTPGGASVTAACFLENFTRKYTWAHLDIAGTAWKIGRRQRRDRPSGAAADDVPDQPHLISRINTARIAVDRTSTRPSVKAASSRMRPIRHFLLVDGLYAGATRPAPSFSGRIAASAPSS